MSSLRQIEANRRNALKSTGPTSVAGKAVSSMNALKTGIHAKSLVLPTEKLADLEHLIEEYYHHHQPASPEARLLLDDLIQCEWTLRRLHAAEAQAWQHQDSNGYKGPQKYPLGNSVTSYASTFSKLQYRLDATRRAIHRNLQALKQLQSEAGAAPTAGPSSLSPSPQTLSPQIGFLPSTAIPAPQQAPSATPNPDLHPHEHLGSSPVLSSGTHSFRLSHQLHHGSVKYPEVATHIRMEGSE